MSTSATEAEGIASHGLAYIPTYCEHLRCGKVAGQAVPVLTRPRPGVICADAGTGFAHPAIAAGFADLIPLAREQGIAALAVRNSYNCGVLGYHTRQLALAGLLGLGFTNAPASIAPVGGRRPVVGTNPFSLAAPDGNGGIALLIDQSASVVAKSEIMKHAREGRPIPEGWGLGPDGQPTTDPAVALTGS
ncbi:MAG: Ldh family oxidoreductase, partial [Pararhodobacter sp.]|nr:Ldh family oxidoreductase [Pararhodobacter sp.]